MRQSAACVLPACAVKRIARVHLLLACGEARCVRRATGTLLARTAVRVARVQLLRARACAVVLRLRARCICYALTRVRVTAKHLLARSAAI